MVHSRRGVHRPGPTRHPGLQVKVRDLFADAIGKVLDVGHRLTCGCWEGLTLIDEPDPCPVYERRNDPDYCPQCEAAEKARHETS